jgi:hypothetical protein
MADAGHALPRPPQEEIDRQVREGLPLPFDLGSYELLREPDETNDEYAARLNLFR